MNFKKITENISYISGSDYCSNIYILKDSDATIIIDTGDGNTEIKEKADFCFLTHGHMDHTNGARKDWQVFIREEEKKFDEQFPYHVPEFAKSLQVQHMKVGSFDFEFIHTPGHTPGGMCIWEKKRNILFTGDTLFSDGWVGRTDMPGGDYKNLEASLRLLFGRFAEKKEHKIMFPFDLDELDLNISFMCPGHGEPRKF
jgi:glyoxylase-like metal-dependent hydrolase (beta-lactamase superfamily II)